MFIDTNIGGGIDGTSGADTVTLTGQVRAAERIGFDGLWSTEVNRDPFLPLAIAAEKSTTLRLGTGVAVAFARSPMTTALAANDLQSLSGWPNTSWRCKRSGAAGIPASGSTSAASTTGTP
jgi:alkanesulfonate monooxygenase SsuD/methylene tetrahydromethanopterin reductase-like flavin-dependent oxidoreductase (luciferase family)